MPNDEARRTVAFARVSLGLMASSFSSHSSLLIRHYSFVIFFNLPRDFERQLQRRRGLAAAHFRLHAGARAGDEIRELALQRFAFFHVHRLPDVAPAAEFRKEPP